MRSWLLVLIVIAVPISTGCVSNPFMTANEEPAPGFTLIPNITRPLIDGVFDSGEWEGAYHTAGVFAITDRSPASGEYPLGLWMGLADQALTIAAEIKGLPPPPFDSEDSGHPYSFDIFLASDTAAIPIPSDNLHIDLYPQFGTGHFIYLDGYWNGSDWALQGPIDNRPFNDGKPTGRDMRGEVVNGTLRMEFHIPADTQHKDFDGLSLAPGTVLRMALKFSMQSPEGWDFHSDTWAGGNPSKTTKDASTWLRFRVPE